MVCSKESLYEDADKGHEPDQSVVSKIFRLIKGMQGSGTDGSKKRKPKQQRKKKLGRGPGGERDFDMEDNSDDENYEENGPLSLVDIRARVLNAGFTEAQLIETIQSVSFALYVATFYTDCRAASMRTLISGYVWPAVPSFNSPPPEIRNNLLSLCFANFSFLVYLLGIAIRY